MDSKKFLKAGAFAVVHLGLILTSFGLAMDIANLMTGTDSYGIVPNALVFVLVGLFAIGVLSSTVFALSKIVSYFSMGMMSVVFLIAFASVLTMGWALIILLVIVFGLIAYGMITAPLIAFSLISGLIKTLKEQAFRLPTKIFNAGFVLTTVSVIALGVYGLTFKATEFAPGADKTGVLIMTVVALAVNTAFFVLRTKVKIDFLYNLLIMAAFVAGIALTIANPVPVGVTLDFNMTLIQVGAMFAGILALITPIYSVVSTRLY